MTVPSGDPRPGGAKLRDPPPADQVLDRLHPDGRFEDPEGGYAEEQTFIPTPAGRIFTTLVEPLRERREIGFLICHSFAYEQLDLFRLDLTFSRIAAAAGFPALYFQARGYADSGGDLGEATHASHVRDALAAAEHLCRRTGVGGVVPVGARWGAAVALAASGPLDAPGVVLWNPSLDPRRYLDDLLKVFARSRIAGKAQRPDEPSGPTREQLQGALAAGEDVDLFGYPLSSRCYGEAAADGPMDRLGRAPGRALLVVVNPRVVKDVEQAAERLRDLGSDARVDHAEGPDRAQFCLGASPAGKRVVIGQKLFEDVAARTVAWAQEIWTTSASVPRMTGTIPEAVPSIPEVREVPVYIRSREERLAAVVTVPEDPGSTTGVVLLASRARDRAHRNGLWVKAARTLASDSLYVLRLDYPGVGNSTGSPVLFGQKDMPSWAVDDACRFLLDRTPVRRILLVGTCYGGRVVLDTASRLTEVAAVALVVAPVLRPLSSKGRIRIKAARLLGRGVHPSADLEQARFGGIASMSDRRIDPAFAGALRRFLARGRVYFLYGEQDHYWQELRFALGRLRLPPDRYEVDLVPGEIDSFRSIAMQSLTHEHLAAWCRRTVESLRDPV